MMKDSHNQPKNPSTAKKLGLAIAIVAANTHLCMAAPQGATVVDGTVDKPIVSSADMTITQTSNSVTINWESFGVGNGETVTFVQPSANAVALNNITGQNPSEIFGQIKANGKVFLSNPNGIFFKPGSQLNVGALVATTSNISFDDTLNLTNSTSTSDKAGQISIEGTINTANNANGFVAFFAPDITTGSASKISTDGGKVLLSNGLSGSVTLPGLDVGFDTTGLDGINNEHTISHSGKVGKLEGDMDSEIVEDNTHFSLEGGYITLSTENLAELVNNVVAQPEMLTAETLKLDFKERDVPIINDETGELSETEELSNFKIVTLLDTRNLEIDGANIVYSNEVNDHINLDDNDNSDGQRSLILNASNSITIDHDIIGSNLDLSLYAPTVNTDTDFNVTGATLQSLTVGHSQGKPTAKDSSATFTSDIITIDSIRLLSSSNTFTNKGDNHTFLLGTFTNNPNANIEIAGALTFNNQNNGEDYGDMSVASNRVSIRDTSGFRRLTLLADEIAIAGQLSTTSSFTARKSGSSESARTTLLLEGDADISSSNIEFRDTIFESSLDVVNNNPYTLTLIDNKASNTNSFKITNAGYQSEVAENRSQIGNLVVTGNNTTNEDTAFRLSGDLGAANYTVADTKIDLQDSTTLHGVESADFSTSTIQGRSSLTLNGKSNTASTATIGQIGGTSKLTSINVSNFKQLTLLDSIATSGEGISLSATNINIGGGTGLNNNSTLLKDITFSEGSTGNITLAGTVSKGVVYDFENTANEIDSSLINTQLTLSTESGAIEVDDVSGLNSFTLKRATPNSDPIKINGNINVIDTLDWSNLSNVVLTYDNSSNSTNIEAKNINLNGTSLTSLNTEPNASGIANIVNFNTKVDNSVENLLQLSDVTANEINIISNKIELSGDITAEKINLNDNLSGVSAITLTDDVILQGHINFFDANYKNRPTINSANSSDLSSLTLLTGGNDVTLYSFGDTTPLSSLKVEGQAVDSNDPKPTVTFKIDDKEEGDTGIPKIKGSNGYIFHGDLSLEFEESLTFDTSDFGGNIDFRGMSIEGEGVINLDAGDGHILLSSIGISEKSEITDLYINSATSLTLNGDILLKEGKDGYDFSNVAKEVTLYSDVILGNSEFRANVNFGDTKINGTRSLTLFANDVVLGEINEKDAALQDLSIFATEAITLDKAISIVGDVNIQAEGLTLDNTFTTTGGEVNITTENDFAMTPTAILSAPNGNITLSSTAGNVSISKLVALNDVTITASNGKIENSINDFTSENEGSSNIQSTNISLNAGNIGGSSSTPIVFTTDREGEATLASSSKIYIANINNTKVISEGEVIDSTHGSDAAIEDALNQLNRSSLGVVTTPTLESTLGLISNPTWQSEDDVSIRKLNIPDSAPAIRKTKKGWRLGN